MARYFLTSTCWTAAACQAGADLRRRLACRGVPVTAMLVVVLLAAVGPCALHGRAGRVQTTTGGGLVMNVDARWMPGPAYRCVQIELVPQAASAADRTLSIEFLTRSPWSKGIYDQRVAQDVEIPAGSGPVRLAMAVPQSVGGYYQVSVSEDGQVIKGLSQPWIADGDNFWTMEGSPAAAMVEGVPRALVISRGKPQLGAMTSALVMLAAEQSPRVRDTIAWNLRGTGASPATLEDALRNGSVPANSTNVQVVDPSLLSNRWVDYSNYDLIVLSVDDILQLDKQAPAVQQALVRWTGAGGNLVVYGAGDDWQRLGGLERWMGLASVQAPPDSKPTERGWMEPQRRRRPEAAENPENLRGDNRPDAAALPSLVPGGGVPAGSLPKGPARFLYRPVGLGMLVALTSADPFADTPARWRWVCRTVGPERLISSRRLGVSVLGNNPQYWDFLIPGVGVAPVMSFRLLISLFVILIGPANYFLLRRWRRLHLLVITVPATATLATVLLLFYALVADGLGSRVRARSFTSLDQRRGEAVCWARLSYYAGLTPQRGLTFPPDVVTVPLKQNLQDSSDANRDMLWEGTQRLARGWIAARTPMQLVTMRARATDRTLRIVTREDKSAVGVENRLGTRLGQLVLRTEGDRYYWAENVAAGATVEARAIGPVDATSRLRNIARMNRPEPPIGYRQLARGQRGIRNRRSSEYAGIVRSYSGPEGGQNAASTSRLEQSLATIDPTGDQTGLVLEPDSYVTIADTSPELELGLAGASEESSFHVILGKW